MTGNFLARLSHAGSRLNRHLGKRSWGVGPPVGLEQIKTIALRELYTLFGLVTLIIEKIQAQLQRN